MNAIPLVHVEGITKVYEPASKWFRLVLRSQIDEPVRALDDVSFSVRGGQVCVVAGANGAGKSTLFRVLTGLVAPTAGAATVAGIDATRPSPELRRGMGFVAADDRSLFLRNTVYENLAFQARVRGFSRSTRERRITESLELVGLEGVRDRTGFALSAGMRTRLQLAGALLHEPQVLVLDEPTGNIDPVGAYELIEQIRLFARERGAAVLISSHRVDEIELLGEMVVLLRRGRLVHVGPLNVLRDTRRARRICIRYRNGEAGLAAEDLGQVEGVTVETLEADSVTFLTARHTGDVLGLLRAELSAIVAIEEQAEAARDLLVRVLDESRAEAGVNA